MSRKSAFLLAVLLTVASAGAALSGDKDKGLAYARAACTECHAVEPGAGFRFIDIPSFQEVADTGGMNERALVVWLNTSHRNMPDFIIRPDDTENIAAYIMSLKAGK